MKIILAFLSLALACFGSAHAQSIPISPKLFGINYWFYDYASNVDNFNTKKAEVKAAGIRLVRLGGNAPNKRLALADMAAFDIAIDRVVSIDATPLMQLPINLPEADIATWVTHFKAKGIKYWAIGNEPDPSSNFIEWYKGAVVGGTLKRENGNTYAEFRTKFVRLARAVKAMDAEAIVVGPDFRQFWGTSNASEPLMSYYPDFIADVGTMSENGAPLLDIFALHFYGYHNEAENKKRIALLQSYLDGVNASRATPIFMAVGEVNATTGASGASQPWSFDAGQFLVVMTKNVVANRGVFVAPWSVYEGSGAQGATDFSTFNSNDTPRSTMVHFSLLAQHQRAAYMAGAMENAALANQIVQFGMTDAGGSTVMIMNTSASGQSYAARLDDRYPALSAGVRLKFASTNASPVEWAGTIAAKTTLLMTFDGTGRRLKKVEYNKAISDAAHLDTTAAPVITDLTVLGAVSGGSGDIVLSALVAENAPRSKVEFFVDGVLAGSAASAPYAASIDSAALSNGEHVLTVKAVDIDGNIDSAAPLAFTVHNPANVSAQVSTVSTGLVLNRSTQTFNGRITLTNTGAAVAGPMRVILSGLPDGVSLVNASGMHKGEPYLSIDVGLPPGAAVTAPLSFANPSRAAMRYVPIIYSGNF